MVARQVFIKIILVLSVVLLLPLSAAAQSLVLREVDAKPVLEGGRAQGELRYYVNGPSTIGPELDLAETIYFGRFSRLVMAYAALSLADEGLLDPEAPLFEILPDLIEENPFEPPIRVQHLIAEIAGFAVPPWYGEGSYLEASQVSADAPIEPYLIPIRYAGRMYHDDIVASALLVRVLEAVSGQNILDLLNQRIAAVLGYTDSLSFDEKIRVPDAFRPTLALQGPRGFVLALARQLYERPRRPLVRDGALALLIERTEWTLHPLSLTRTLGLERQIAAGHRMLVLGSNPCEVGVSIAAFPAQDLVFIRESTAKPSCDGQTFYDQIKAVARDHFPPGRWQIQMEEAARSLPLPNRLSGFYVRETLPRADLASRLSAIHLDTYFLKVEGQSGRFVLRRGGDGTVYQPTGPLVWQSETPGRENTLVLSPIGGHGYLYTSDGTLYRFIGLLGDMRLVLSPLPWMLILMASGGLHLLNKTSPQWRRMGLNALLGTLLFGTGLAAELNGWAATLYAHQMPWLVVLWRVVFNAGLALILSVTIYGLIFARKKDMLPMGPWFVPVAFHLTALTGGSLILFLLTVAWGVTGTITPY